MLAPFGLAGILTGQAFKQGDTNMRLLEEWAQFYPMDKVNCSTGEYNVVEVIVGGVKMRYPACYVLVTDMDDSTNNCALNTGLLPNNISSNGITKNGNSKYIFVSKYVDFINLIEIVIS